jgi:hypothetical protein
VAAGAFVLFYGAEEAILGIAVGVLVEHANRRPTTRGARAARRHLGVRTAQASGLTRSNHAVAAKATPRVFSSCDPSHPPA